MNKKKYLEKLTGVFMLCLGLITPCIIGDATILVITIPLGVAALT